MYELLWDFPLQLADFEQLLSHYDARLAKKLNDEYLKEEWDFGQENLGSKKMFKDPPIICAEERMEMVGDPQISRSLNTTHNLTQVLRF